MTDAGGAHRWPAVPMELLFNIVFLAWAVIAHRRDWIPGNRFHIYLIAYGTFRFGHEFLRDDVPMFGAISGYHLIALAMVAFGVIRFVQRREHTHGPATLSSKGFDDPPGVGPAAAGRDEQTDAHPGRLKPALQPAPRSGIPHPLDEFEG